MENVVPLIALAVFIAPLLILHLVLRRKGHPGLGPIGLWESEEKHKRHAREVREWEEGRTNTEIQSDAITAAIKGLASFNWKDFYSHLALGAAGWLLVRGFWHLLDTFTGYSTAQTLYGAVIRVVLYVFEYPHFAWWLSILVVLAHAIWQGWRTRENPEVNNGIV